MSTSLARKPIPSHAQKVFEGKIFSFWQWEQELFDGSKTIFERISRPDAAFVLGVLPDKKLLLIEDEQPDRQPIITLPGGGLDKDEAPVRAAERELLEETGYAAAELTPWYEYSLPGKVSATFHVFIGKGLEQKKSAEPEPGEKIKLMPMSFDEFFMMVEKQVDRYSPLRTHVLEMMLDAKKKQEFYELLYG